MSTYAINHAPEFVAIVFSDFETIAGTLTAGGFNIIESAGASVTAGTATSNQFGVVQINTGTGTFVHLGQNQQNIVPGNGIIELKMNVNLPALASSAGTSDYSFRFGLTNGTAGTEPTAGILFELTSSTANYSYVGNWAGLALTASTAITSVNTGITVASATYYQLRLVVNPAANNVDFYVNGVRQAWVTTNIPKVVLSPFVSLNQDHGTSGYSAYIDYIWQRYEFTTPR